MTLPTLLANSRTSPGIGLIGQKAMALHGPVENVADKIDKLGTMIDHVMLYSAMT